MTSTEVDETTAGERDGTTTLRPDDLFHSLQNERRRRVLRLLLDGGDETVDVGEIAERIAAVENDCSRAQVTSNQRKRVYIALYQCHLPQLDDVAMIEYEQSRGRVSPGPTLDQVARYLAMTDERGRDATASASGSPSTTAEEGETAPETAARASAAAVANAVVAAVAVVALAGAWVGVVAASVALAAVTVVAVLAAASGAVDATE